MHFLIWVSLGILSVAASFGPTSARACDLAEPPTIIAAFPADGASAVPMDVRPLLIGGVTEVMVASDEVEPPDFQLEREPYGVEVRFEQALAPNTRYTLIADEEQSVSFTTGADVSSGDAPQLDVRVSIAQSEPGLCAITEWLCVHAEVPNDFALVVERDIAGGKGTTVLPPGMQRPALGYLQPGDTQWFGSWTDGECLRVTTRALDGNLGEWQRFCRDELDLLMGRVDGCSRGRLEGAFDQGQEPSASEGGEPDGGHEPNAASSSSGGCALSGTSPAFGGSALLLGLIAFARALRRVAQNGMSSSPPPPPPPPPGPWSSPGA
jgi:hypothetical protein